MGVSFIRVAIHSLRVTLIGDGCVLHPSCDRLKPLTNIIGRMDPGWQPKSGSLVFDAWIDLWSEIAESGPDHGNKITIVSPSIEGAKMGWPVPTAGDFALVRHRVRCGSSRHRHMVSPRSCHAVTGCTGRPYLQRNDDLEPVASVKQFPEC